LQGRLRDRSRDRHAPWPWRAGLYSDVFKAGSDPAKWLEPYTEPTLEKLAREGVHQVDVVCPGFVADCLETLEEISIECRDAYLHAGGKQFRYIPCLNDDPRWIEGLADLIEKHTQGWPLKIS